MKYSAIICFLLCIGLTLSAQTAKQFVLLERFTNTFCGACAFHNPVADAVVEANRDDVHHLVYYPSVPYTGCPIYQSNIPDYGTRQSFYGVPGTPQMYYLGILNGSGSNMISQADIDIQQGLTSDVRLKLNESVSGSNVTVSTTLDVYNTPSTGNLRLFVAAVQGELLFNAANGETDHLDVMRTFLTSNSGTLLSGVTAGSSQTFTHSYTIDPSWDASEMYTIAWVQSFSNDLILNSGSSKDIIIDVMNVSDESCAGLNDGSASINVSGGENNAYNITWSNGMTGMNVGGLAPGSYTVSVSNGVQSNFSQINIGAGGTASASINSVPSVLSSMNPVPLTASPAGGTFSGPGVVMNTFNPAMVGNGLQTISYSYTDASGCNYVGQTSIFVFDLNYYFINYNSGTISP